MYSFTLSLPFVALIAIFANAAFRNSPDEMGAAAPAEFARAYERSKERYKARELSAASRPEAPAPKAVALVASATPCAKSARAH